MLRNEDHKFKPRLGSTATYKILSQSEKLRKGLGCSLVKSKMKHKDNILLSAQAGLATVCSLATRDHEGVTDSSKYINEANDKGMQYLLKLLSNMLRVLSPLTPHHPRHYTRHCIHHLAARERRSGCLRPCV